MGGAKLERKMHKRKMTVEEPEVGSDDQSGELQSLAVGGSGKVKKQKHLRDKSKDKTAVGKVVSPLPKQARKESKEDQVSSVIGTVPSLKSPGENNFRKEKVKTKHLQRDSESKKSASGDGIIYHEDGGLAVTVSGRKCENPKFKPCTSFELEGVPNSVLGCCRKFDKPSPIQAHAWPFLLAGRDLIGIARTGSGKTLAFGIPGMVHVLKKQAEHGKRSPLALVLAPTRELTQQIADVLDEAGAGCGVKVACVYGGTSKGPQKAALRAGATVIVATPGRLQDLIEDGVCSLSLVSFVVLDEADRMLDLGFEPAIRAIISMTSKSRQTLMFSATWPASVDKLGKEFMQDTNKIVKVTVGSEDLTANHDVKQIVEVLDDKERMPRLEALLRQYHKSRTNRVIVFVLYKKEAVRMENSLYQRGWKVAAVHGDKGQSDRTRAVQSFKDGTCPLLVATDVAARGLDIPDVEYVINFSFPLTVEDYVHRIGRTGRAGKKGIAHTFFTQADKARAGELANVLKEAGQEIPPELLKFGTHVKKKESALYGAHFKEISANAKQATKITFNDSDEE